MKKVSYTHLVTSVVVTQRYVDSDANSRLEAEDNVRAGKCQPSKYIGDGREAELSRTICSIELLGERRQ